MSTPDVSPDAPAPVTRDELITMVTRAHQDSAYGESTLAGKTLAAQSKLPRVIAENLGAGFGQWDFFPEAVEIVDFAHGYVPPSTEEDVWALARTWASDDAAGRHTLMALVGREILLHELRRIAVPKLRELFEARPSQALVLRVGLGLDAPPPSAAPVAKARPKRAAAASAAGASGAGAGAGAPAKRPAPNPEIPMQMPKPAFVPPPKRAPAPPPKRFEHPKFGVGVLQRQDGEGPEAKLTIKFAAGLKTLLAQYVTELSA